MGSWYLMQKGSSLSDSSFSILRELGGVRAILNVLDGEFEDVIAARLFFSRIVVIRQIEDNA